jgi:putative ABC transport system permease protein
MSTARLVLRSLFYHWRGNSAVLLGVAVGCAVLAGALLVGDSLRGSLRDLTLQQLAWVDHSLVTGRFFREDLGKELDAGRVSPTILVQGSASTGIDTSQTAGLERGVHRARKVALLGVNSGFWRGPGAAPVNQAFWDSEKEEVVLNAALADDLEVAAGGTVTLHLQKVSLVPRETLLGRREAGEVVDDLPLRVAAVIPNEGEGRFSLNPNPATPRNAFVPLRTLQSKLRQEKRVNALLVGGGDSQHLQDALRQHLTLEDWGLVLHTPESRAKALFDKLDRNHDGKLTRNEWRRRVAESFALEADRNRNGELDREEVIAFYKNHRRYLSLESRQMLLEPAVADAALAAAQATGLRAAPTLVYLANRISDGTKAIPYSIVAALDPSLQPPLGPFLPEGVRDLKEGEIVLADWKESPLRMQPGEKIALRYFEPEEEGKLRESTATFQLRGVVPLQGAANDPDLTPEFPGITDKLDLREWNPPFPYDNKLVQPVDERYWEEYRTTPKAYITLAEGQRLWGSRFGRLTSIRLAEPATFSRSPQASEITDKNTSSLAKAAEDFRRRLLSELRPEQGGMVFDAVRQRSLEGSAGATDFGKLFFAFSTFLIAAALLLVGLLFRLNIDRRAEEMGLLLAMGYRRRTVRGLLLAEGSLLAVVGGLVGLAGAAVYGWLMVGFLRAWWPGTLDRSFLRLHVTSRSLGIGYVAAIIVSILTIAWAVRILGRVSPRALLAGETAEEPQAGAPKTQVRWSPWVTAIAGVAALGCLILGGFVKGQEEQAMTFFSSGALLLTASLSGTWWWMRSSSHGRTGGSGRPGLARLGVRNAARHPSRSLLTAGLLASATFLVVAVESFYRDPGKDFLDIHSGSGGFSLLAESDLPIYQDLNTAKGLDELNFPARARANLQGVTFYPFRLHGGDDASCLNLYQPKQPRLLGVPQRLIQRGGFQFKQTDAVSPEEKANPWHLLRGTTPDGAIPVFGEANTVEWMLHSKLGGELTVLDERGEPVRLRVVGLLQDSVFQSSLLLSEANLLKLYPRQEGYQFFLLEASPQRGGPVKTILETVLGDQGFVVTPTAQRLESYLAVENTYLSTFQALGGLGLVLGALGLAVVLLRSVWERRGELALLRAVGFRKSALAWLVLAENGFLLVLGLLIGTVSALLAVAPHLVGARGQVPWLYLLDFLAIVLVVGWVAGAAAVAATLRAPLIPALRRE